MRVTSEKGVGYTLSWLGAWEYMAGAWQRMAIFSGAWRHMSAHTWQRMVALGWTKQRVNKAPCIPMYYICWRMAAHGSACLCHFQEKNLARQYMAAHGY